MALYLSISLLRRYDVRVTQEKLKFEIYMLIYVVDHGMFISVCGACLWSFFRHDEFDQYICNEVDLHMVQ